MDNRHSGLVRSSQTIALGCALAIGGLAMAPPAAGQEKILRVGVGELSKAKGNPYVGSGLPHIYVWAAMYDAMIDVDVTGTPRPLLTESWQNVEPTTWRFKLKPNVQFQNGRPLTSAAIVEMFAYLATEDGRKTVRGAAANAAGITSVTAVDNQTVEFKTRAGNAILPTLLSNFDVPEPRHFAEVGADGVREKPIGTGPYTLTVWTSTTARLTAHAGYHGGKPKLDAVMIVELPEAAARRDAMLSNQIDIDTNPLLDDFKRLRAAGITIDVSPASNVGGITLISAGQVDGRGKQTIFVDKRVRQAMNMAIDRETMSRELTEGLGIVGTQAATSGTFGFNPNVPKYPYDPAGARKLLADAGHPNGFKIRMPALTQDPLAKLVYERALADLGKVGIQGELIGVTLAEWLKHFVSGTWHQDGAIAFGGAHALNPEMDASAALGKYTSCHKRPEVSIFYCDEGEAKLLDAAAVEFDPAKRKAILQNLMQLNHDNNSTVLLLEIPRFMSYNKRVTGFHQAFTKIYYGDVGLN